MLKTFVVYVENKPGVLNEYRILRQLDATKAQKLYDAAPANLRN